MALWYDISDLMHWHLPHLTGIQRTVVGILNGFHSLDIYPKLVSFDREKYSFRSVELNELPSNVLQYIHISDVIHFEPPESEIQPETYQIKNKLKTLLGTDPVAQELLSNVHRFLSSGISIPRSMLKWLLTRNNDGNQIGAENLEIENKAYSLPNRNNKNPFKKPSEKDIILSFGASWTIPGHATAVSSLQSQDVKVVRMIYDLIPTLKPQWVNKEDETVFTNWVRSLLHQSDIIFTISEFSKKEIMRYCTRTGINKPLLEVVRLGDVMESEESKSVSWTDEAIPTSIKSQDRPFFLCVSTLDVRKNHRLLYDAWSLMTAQDPDNCPDLVCLGSQHLFVDDLIQEIKTTPKVNERIYLLNDIDDTDLEWYYKNCLATIYPSRYEGWGLPVAESLVYGRVCLASHATSIPEISNDLPEFFDPLNVYELLDLIQKCLQDDEWVEQKETEIREAFKPTPWEHTAKQILNKI